MKLIRVGFACIHHQSGLDTAAASLAVFHLNATFDLGAAEAVA